MRRPDQEACVETGLALAAAAVLGAFGVIALGQAVGSVRRWQGHAEPPPTPGRVPAGQHTNIAGSPAR